MNWQQANREVFEDALNEGNWDSAQAAIDDAKSRKIDTADMESELQHAITQEKLQDIALDGI